MIFITTLLDFILHIDKHLAHIITNYKELSYLILALIIFVETGLVIMPLLPGDSLLFAAGAIIATTHTLSIYVLIPLLIAAAILGDNTNYFIGRYLGKKVLHLKYLSRLIKPEYITRTENYFKKYGSRTIIMARFIPIVRTITPFVAGIGEMKYITFLLYSFVGAVVWVTSLTCLGYYFGNLEIIKNNFEIVIFAIIGISLLPVIIQLFQSKSKST